MAEYAELEERSNSVVRNDLYGRLDIYATVDDITPENVMEELNSALVFHIKNMMEEEFLYWYRRGIQPILGRTKDVREDILNIVQENHAEEFTAFKNGYFLTAPVNYSARRKGVQTRVKKLNEFLYRSGKYEADNKTADWFHTVGKGVLYVEPNDDPEVPFKAYSLDPRSAFVCYSLRPGNAPVMGVNTVTVDGKVKFDVWTEKYVFRLSGTQTGKLMSTEKTHNYLVTATSLDAVESNVLGRIPVIEYRYNSVNMGCFEAVIPLLDEINNITSNACDGIEQFIQALAIAVNCEFEEGTTLSDIRKAGFIQFRSTGENKAEFKLLTEQLDQTQTKVLVDRLYDQALRIAALPARSSGQSTQSTTGQAVLANFGWYQADCAARNTEDLYIESNRQFDAIVVDILKRKNLLDIELTDFEPVFTHGEVANVQAKAQAYQTLMAAGLHPELAMQKSGISNDPVKDAAMSEEYIKLIWGDPSQAVKAEDAGNGRGEATVIESDNNNGESNTGL